MSNKTYPDDFKKRVIAEFPNCVGLHKALESGSDIVGRYLDDSSTGGISAETIIKAFEDNEREKVLEMAKKIVRIKALCEEWYALRRSGVYI
jgi:hypothetical protein